MAILSGKKKTSLNLKRTDNKWKPPENYSLFICFLRTAIFFVFEFSGSHFVFVVENRVCLIGHSPWRYRVIHSKISGKFTRLRNFSAGNRKRGKTEIFSMTFASNFFCDVSLPPPTPHPALSLIQFPGEDSPFSSTEKSHCPAEMANRVRMSPSEAKHHFARAIIKLAVLLIYCLYFKSCRKIARQNLTWSFASNNEKFGLTQLSANHYYFTITSLLPIYQLFIHFIIFLPVTVSISGFAHRLSRNKDPFYVHLPPLPC